MMTESCYTRNLEFLDFLDPPFSEFMELSHSIQILFFVNYPIV